MIRPSFTAAIIALALAACATDLIGANTQSQTIYVDEQTPLANPPTTEVEDPSPGLDEEADTAYHQCLRDNMAVAMAWEAIEQMCRNEAAGENK